MSDPVSADGRRHKSEVAAARRRVTTSASIGLLLLRLGFGALLVIRGLQHARDIDGFTAIIRQAHVPFPVPISVAAWITTVGELGLGILLAVGFLTRVAGGLVAVLMGLVLARPAGQSPHPFAGGRRRGGERADDRAGRPGPGVHRARSLRRRRGIPARPRRRCG